MSSGCLYRMTDYRTHREAAAQKRGNQPYVKRHVCSATYTSLGHLLLLRMHFEVVRFELIFSIEVFTAILTGVTRMHFAVMLLPLHLTFKGCTAFFTAILIIILSHRILLLSESDDRFR